MLGLFLLLLVATGIILGLWAIGKPEHAKAGLVVLSVATLFMGGCSLFFVSAAVIDWSVYSPAILMFSLPFLIVGTLVWWFGWRRYKRTTQPGQSTNDGSR